MINEISLDYLKIFYLVAKECNITRVAEKMYISQSAVTQTIQKLEGKLGFSLFVRKKRNIELSKIGKGLYDSLVPVFCDLEVVDLYLKNLNSLAVGDLKIACGTNLGKRVLVNPICKFSSLYPGVKIKQFDGASSDMEEMLSSGKIDVFIAQKDEKMQKKYNFLPILAEKYIFVCSKKYFENDYKNGKMSYILQGEKAKSREVFEEYATKNNLNFECVFEVVGYNMMIEMCKKDKGIIMVPSYLVDNEIMKGIFVEVENKNLPIIEYFAYTNKLVKNYLVDTFLKLLNA